MIESNRIFCTFSTKESLEENIAKITSTYTIPGGRLFVLRAIEEEMFLLTYNLEFENLAKFPENTILVHRKKDFNVLYTINALNFLVKQITGGKIFTLQSIEQELFLLTYNLDFGNLAHFPKNTILVHRKKGYNVLYTINALNLIVKQLTGGFVDQKKNVDWGMYRNSLLLTESTQLKQIKTKLFSIKSLEL